MTVADIRDFIASLHLANPVYLGKLDAKMKNSIGVYPSKHEHAYKTALGGTQNESYGTKYVTFLVHWNKSPRETEKAAMELFRALQQARESVIHTETIKFIQPLVNEPVDIGTDEAGIYEMVIEAAVIYERKGE